jgi:hypothetical protein
MMPLSGTAMDAAAAAAAWAMVWANVAASTIAANLYPALKRLVISFPLPVEVLLSAAATLNEASPSVIHSSR